MFNEWDNPEAIQEIINKSKSKREVLERMGYNKENGHRIQKLRYAIRRFDLDISSFRNTAYYKQTLGAFNDWDNPDAIQEILNRSKSKRDALVNMGYSKSNGHKLRFLMIAIEKYELDISNFNDPPDRWNKNNLKEIVKNSISYAEVLRKIGLVDRGGNIITLKKYIKRFNIDVSHFIGMGRGTTKGMLPHNKKLKNEIFCENSQVSSQTVRKHLINNELVKYKCSKCGIIDEWQNEQIVLEMDHINGNYKDNRLENLRFLCPNCHSQTPTHRGKNRKKNSA